MRTRSAPARSPNLILYVDNRYDRIMLRRSSLVGLALAGLILPSRLPAQFTPREIAERPQWEEFLKTAEIVGFEPIGEGVTRPIRLSLKKGDRNASGVWKNPSGIRGGYLEGWRYEIAAYELDKLLGLNMIPPTVERKFQGERGSLQLWVKVMMNDLERMKALYPRSRRLRPALGKDEIPDTGF